MTEFNDFLQSLENDKQKATMEDIFNWVSETFPKLETTVKSKQHFSVAPEAKAIAKFTKQIDASAYSQTNNLFRIKWSQDVDYSLLKSIIQFNIEDKADCTTFWRS